MNYRTVIYWLFTLATISCTTNRKLSEKVKGNWLNENDSIQWIMSLQPEFAIYRNQFWEYDKVSGSNRRLKISLKNQEGTDVLWLRVNDNNSISANSTSGKEWQLTRKKAVKPDFYSYDTIGFGDVKLQDDTAVIIGFIEDYDPELFIGTGSITLYNAMNGLKRELAETNFTIDSNGRFEVSLRAYNPQLAHLVIDGSTYTQVIVSPGDTLIIGLNGLLITATEDNRVWEDIYDWNINHYMGKYGMLSEELIVCQNAFAQYTMPVIKIENIDAMPQLEYISWRKKVFTNEKHIMDSLLSAFGCSLRARQYFNIYLDNEFFSDLYRYQISGSRLQPIGPLYTNQILETDFSVANMLNQNYVSYINYLSFYEMRNPMGSENDAVQKYYLNYLLNEVKNTDDHQLIENLLKKPVPVMEDFNWSNNEDQSGYDRFISMKVSEMNKDYYKLMESYNELIPDSVIRKAFLNGLNISLQKYGHNLFSNLFAAYRIQNYHSNSSLGPEGREWILKNLSEPVIQKVMLEKLDRKITEENTCTNYVENTWFIDQISLPENPEALFDTLISQFKGKVIYIDFWADWCSPCREAFKYVKKLKQLYAGQDVVFLYLGYSCKKENWDKAIKHDQISGYHYWLDKKQSDLMKEKFGIVGIPHYLLVDKNGVIYDKDIPGPASRTTLASMLDMMIK